MDSHIWSHLVTFLVTHLVTVCTIGVCVCSVFFSYHTERHRFENVVGIARQDAGKHKRRWRRTR